MAGTITARCPNCGTLTEVPAGSKGPVGWFPCPHCAQPVPFLPSGEARPLFSWEVYPGLYPRSPPTRPGRIRRSTVSAVGLAVAAAFAIALAASFAVLSVEAAGPDSFSVGGTVACSGGTPFTVVVVTLTTEANAAESATTTCGGAFAFAGVPTGGDVVNASAPGFGWSAVAIFLSPVYASTPPGALSLLLASGATNTSYVSTTAFPTLESFLTATGSASVLFGIVGALALLAIVRREAVWGACAGYGASLAVLVPFTLGLAAPFPLLAGAVLGAGFGGAVAAGVNSLELVVLGERPPPASV